MKLKGVNAGEIGGQIRGGKRNLEKGDQQQKGRKYNWRLISLFLHKYNPYYTT